MQFTLKTKDTNSKARTGTIVTDHGTIETPIFMPVGTLGSVKGIGNKQLNEEIKAEIILGNTYHLYLRPGTDIIEQAGGIQKFNAWNKPMLTDSGGYQVYSLAEKRKIQEEGVEFRSHVDGSKHFFSPERAIDIQRSIGADIIMAFDECTPYPCEKDYAENSMHMTHRWLDRCIEQFNNTECPYGYTQELFPIVQGSVYTDLRKQSAEYIANTDCFGNAIGGLSVGEPAEMMYEMTDEVCKILPSEKPRYLMGVGTPANILECIALGIDMFDCVMPTRNGRNGQIFTENGIINLRNKKWSEIHSPVDPVITPDYSLAFLRHLIHCGEMLGSYLASLHNLKFYLWLVKEARKHIEEGDFTEWKNKMVIKTSTRL
jgi:queuine tRNA-ribosyltransferase